MTRLQANNYFTTIITKANLLAYGRLRLHFQCRTILESVLLSIGDEGAIEATSKMSQICSLSRLNSGGGEGYVVVMMGGISH